MKTPKSQYHYWCYNRLLLLVFTLLEFSARGDAFDHWTSADVATNYYYLLGTRGLYFTGVAYGNGRYVGVASELDAEDSFIEISNDGLHWSLLSRYNTPGNVADITFGNGMFVSAWGFPGKLLTSSNGLMWTSYTPTSMNLRRVIYDGGLFVAVGTGQSEITGATTNRNIFTSPDGITWTAQNSAAPPDDVQPITDVAYGAGRFVAVDSARHYYRSSNGSSWSRRTNTYFSGKISFANGLFIAPSGPGTNLLSGDSINWGLVTNDTGVMFNRIIYGGGCFLAISDANLFTSRDGTNWIPRNLQSPPGLHLNTVALGNRNVVVAGYTLNGFYLNPTAFVSDPIVGLEAKGPSPGQLSISGLIGRTYLIEYVTDLRSNDWQLASAAITLSNSPSIWTDPQATNSSRFYRAVLLP